MTEEAKKNLLDYMLGKMPSEGGVDEPQFIQQNDYINNYKNFLTENFGDKDFWATNYIQASNSENFLLYGWYTIDGVNEYGFNIKTTYGAIIIFENFIPVQAIKSYASGTLFHKFVMLKYDEENNLYGVDNLEIENVDRPGFTNQYRFIMLNNILSTKTINGEYQVTLRQSYIFPTEYNFMSFGTGTSQSSRILKQPNGSSYLMIGRDSDSNNDYKTVVIKLKINVGSENNWSRFFANVYITQDNLDSLCEWNDDVENLIIYGCENNQYIELKMSNGVFSIQYQQNLPSTNDLLQSIIAINNNNIYLATKSTRTNNYETVKILKVNHDSDSFKILHQQEFETYYTGTNVTFVNINNIVFTKISYNSESSSPNEMKNYFGIILKDNYFQRYSGTIIYTGAEDLLFVINTYNLYTLLVQSDNSMQNVKIIYDPNNYNGESFTDKNSLNSNSAILYSDNVPVFARNLYNKTQNGATTTSTIEIPNNYLNDILIDTKNLLSKNNNIIINDTNGLTKNIYETVFLNFVNTISIVNQNESKNSYNIEATTKLNTSINNPIDYDDLKLTKFRINYQDGTNYISTLQAKLQDDNSYQLLMTFYLTKQATSIDLLSEDEKTVYLTYNLANADFNNKYYSFKQRVRIGGLNGTNNISRQSLLK